MYKCAITALGCKVNQCEAEAIKAELSGSFEIVDFSEKADIYIINTCSVTAEGERKSRQTVRRAYSNNENAFICVTGCAAQRAPEIFKNIEGVSLVVGNSQKHLLASMIKKKLQGVFVNDMSKHCTYHDMPDSAIEKTRAFIKIQDGCNNFCTYCIIPYLRGRECSRQRESILKECINLRDQGYKEIVLNGIHLSSYGKEWGYKTDLGDIVEDICNIEGIERVRLGSLEPNVITEEFLNKVTRHKEFMRHYHLSLQSGCDTVLKRMNRKYTSEEYLNAVALIKKNYSLSAISTDIIVGFPGETEEEYNKTLEFVKKAGFAWVHVFPYSVREGTVAAGMKDQNDKHVKAERASKLSALTREIGIDYRKQFVGMVKSVLCETNSSGIQSGLIDEHIPVLFESERLENEIVNVKITKVTDDGLWGERIK
jgi:threonylcarbamoyladenosine tRNA methylthiotransferase MtaB